MEGTMAQIKMFGADFAPRNWAICQGQILAINQNQALFSLLGTTYGGNGVQTFALPDFRGRIPVGTGSAPGLSTYILGETIGTETNSLLTANMPMHNHILTLNSSGNAATLTTPTGNYMAVTEENPGYHPTANAAMASPAIGNAGGNQPFPILPPVLGINFVICLYGIFPSRN